MEGCIFCSIAAGKMPSFKIYEDDVVMAFLDINPVSEGHVLVLPKAHSPNIFETDDEKLSAIISRVKKIAAHIKTALPCDGLNVVQNNGAAAGQSVEHIHFHIIPRKAGDKLTFSGKKGDMGALARLAERIKMD